MKKNRAGKSFTKNQHSYAVAQVGVDRPRSTFMRPSRTLTAIDPAYLYPILVDEVLPGDTYQLSAGLLGRLATPKKPFMDRLTMTTHYWFVPNRLVWLNWKHFQGEKISPDDSTDYTVPQMEVAGGLDGGTLADYMGIPIQATTFQVNAMPFRAYNLIWNEFYRDQNLQDPLTVDTDDANSDEADYVLVKRGRRKDYITGCLPWPQKGDVEPGVISGTVPVTSTGTGIFTVDIGGTGERHLEGTTAHLGVDFHNTPGSIGDVSWHTTMLEADLDTAEANTIAQLRQSIAIQQLLELDARGGTRINEQIKSRFGVTAPDFRLQRPEYLGGVAKT